VWLANGQIINLGTLGGTYSQGFDINDAGKAVGNSGASNEASRGFLWENPTMTELGRLAEVNTHSGANSINNSAAAVEIVGTSQTQGGSTTHAVLWRNGAIMDLGTLGGDNSNADGINDSSQIAGGSLLTGNTAYHAALWVGF
jgi:probable HAF family extracellular repeat protein